MDIDLIYKISSIVAISAALIAALAGGVQWWAGSVISNRQETKIITMERDVRIKKPAIFLQKAISLNTSDGNLFIQKYLVSINSPVVHIPLYTHIQYKLSNGPIERVGEMQLKDIGSGIRQVEGEDVSYVDTEYTLRTNRMLNQGEEIIFTLEKRLDSSIKK